MLLILLTAPRLEVRSSEDALMCRKIRPGANSEKRKAQSEKPTQLHNPLSLKSKTAERLASSGRWLVPSPRYFAKLNPQTYCRALVPVKHVAAAPAESYLMTPDWSEQNAR